MLTYKHTCSYTKPHHRPMLSHASLRDTRTYFLQRLSVIFLLLILFVLPSTHQKGSNGCAAGEFRAQHICVHSHSKERTEVKYVCTHAHTHPRTHARTHARTHTHYFVTNVSSASLGRINHTQPYTRTRARQHTHMHSCFDEYLLRWTQAHTNTRTCTRILQPTEYVRSASLELPQGAMGQSWEYRAGEKMIVWSVKKLLHAQREMTAKVKVRVCVYVFVSMCCAYACACAFEFECACACACI